MPVESEPAHEPVPRWTRSPGCTRSSTPPTAAEALDSGRIRPGSPGNSGPERETWRGDFTPTLTAAWLALAERDDGETPDDVSSPGAVRSALQPLFN